MPQEGETTTTPDDVHIPAQFRPPEVEEDIATGGGGGDDHGDGDDIEAKEVVPAAPRLAVASATALNKDANAAADPEDPDTYHGNYSHDNPPPRTKEDNQYDLLKKIILIAVCVGTIVLIIVAVSGALN